MLRTSLPETGRWRSIIPVVFILAAGCQRGVDECDFVPVPNIEGKAYISARKSLVEAGWLPSSAGVVPKANRRLKGGTLPLQDLPEFRECAGQEPMNCTIEFARNHGEALIIAVSVSAEGEAVVENWQMDCSGTMQ